MTEGKRNRTQSRTVSATVPNPPVPLPQAEMLAHETPAFCFFAGICGYEQRAWCNRQDIHRVSSGYTLAALADRDVLGTTARSDAHRGQ